MCDGIRKVLAGFWLAGLFAAVFFVAPRSAVAQDIARKTAMDVEAETTDAEDETRLAHLAVEARRQAIRQLKRVERRSKKMNIKLNRGKMEKLKGDRLFLVLREFDRFISILEELPVNFVKACGIGTVWFSDELVDVSGQRAGGMASGEGINMVVGFGRGTVYHEMFHKFERCISSGERRDWNDLNPDDFIYEGSAWDSFVGNDKRSKKEAARRRKRIEAGKEKTARQRLEESRSKRDNRRIAANRANAEIQAAFVNRYSQTTPKEDRAEVFSHMMTEGPAFLNRVRRSEVMRAKMEFMIKLTGVDRFLGRTFWSFRVEPDRMKEPEFADVYHAIDTANWRTGKPEDYGFDSARLEKIGAFLAERKMGTSGLFIVVGGRAIFRHGDVSEASDTGPAFANSLLAMMYGPFVRRGLLSLEETLQDLGIDENGGLERRERGATVRDLLTSRSACFLPAVNDPPGRKQPHPRGSRLPGGEFTYCNWGFNAAATVFEMKTRQSLGDAFERTLARPLGFQDWNAWQYRRKEDARVSRHAAHSFGLSVRDMARLGEVMLRKGMWRGLRVLPEDWIVTMTTCVSKFKTGGGYGYLWWIENEDLPDVPYRGAFSARGVGRHRITVLPAYDMVVAHKSAEGTVTRGADYRALLVLIAQAKLPPPPFTISSPAAGIVRGQAK
jgi:hypothetical protein